MKTEIALIAGCMTAAYCCYVVATHGDGVALSALIGALGTLAGYCVGKVKSSSKNT